MFCQELENVVQSSRLPIRLHFLACSKNVTVSWRSKVLKQLRVLAKGANEQKFAKIQEEGHIFKFSGLFRGSKSKSR